MSDFVLGNQLLQSGKPEAAIAAYRRAISRDPSFPWYHYRLGVALEKLGRLKDAITAYQKVVELNPDCNCFYHYRLGIVLIEDEQIDSGIEVFKAGLKLNPTSHQYYQKLGEALARKEEWGESIAHYQKAIEINPDSPQLLSALAYTLKVASASNNSTNINLNPNLNSPLSKPATKTSSLPPRKCVLHIGTEKTGTTAIQQFLSLNKEQLTSQGVLVPTSLGEKNHKHLSLVSYDENHFDSITQSLKVFTSDALKIKQSSLVSEIKEELKMADSGIKTVIFSSEFLQSRLVKASEIKRLYNILENLGLEVSKIILYIRNPIELAVSLVSTSVKSGSLSPDIPLPSKHYFDNLCNHRATIERWSERFGDDKIIVRLYDSKEFYKSSLFKDFCLAADIVFDNEFNLPPKILNKSLDLFGITLLSLLNKDIPYFQKNGRLNPARANLIPFIEKHCSNGTPLIPSPNLVRAYREAFGDSNEWVRKHFFPLKKSLFCDPVYPNVENHFPSVDDFAGLISDIWISKQNKIADLHKQVATLKKSRQLNYKGGKQ